MLDREFKAIAVLAFRSAESPTYEDFIRKVQRWYSRSFATPLVDVEEMADEYLLRHYFEDLYATMADSESDEAHKAWTETRGRLVKAFAPPKPLDPAEPEELSEDDFWEKALEEEFAKDNPDPSRPREPSGKPPGTGETRRKPAPSPYEPGLKEELHEFRTDDEGWTHADSAPNLQGHRDIHIQGDDEIPDEI